MALTGKVKTGAVTRADNGGTVVTAINITGKGMLNSVLNTTANGSFVNSGDIKITIDGTLTTIPSYQYGLFGSYFLKLNLPFSSSLKIEIEPNATTDYYYFVKYVLEY